MSVVFDFSNKKVIVTGGAKGIGKGIAKAYADAGAHVVIADYDETTGIKTKKEMLSLGNNVDFILVDVANEISVNMMVEKSLQLLGGLDILVSNAGIVGKIKGDPLTGIEEKDWDLSYKVNLKGAFFCCKAVYEHFIRQKYGKILITASVAGKTGAPEILEYSAIKAGVINMTQTLAHELGPYNINVNCLCPGFVYTPLYENVAPVYKDKYPEMFKDCRTGEEIVQELVNQFCSIKRIQTVEDIAYGAMFLTADEGKNITGQALNICCGYEFK